MIRRDVVDNEARTGLRDHAICERAVDQVEELGSSRMCVRSVHTARTQETGSNRNAYDADECSVCVLHPEKRRRTIAHQYREVRDRREDEMPAGTCGDAGHGHLRTINHNLVHYL